MPITFISFIVVAASISGVPPFNGFFSKELIYDGALERGAVYYIVAALGSFLTAASFLKLGHAVYLGKRTEATEKTKEAPLAMLIPMVTIAAICVLFGVWNSFPLKSFIQPILGQRLEGHDFAGMPANMMIVIITIAVLIAAVLNHLYGVRRYGSGAKAIDHIHYAPGLKTVYEKAEKGYLDPYNMGMGVVATFAAIASFIDSAINWVYDSFSVKTASVCAVVVNKLRGESYRTYILWSVAAAALMLIYFLR